MLTLQKLRRTAHLCYIRGEVQQGDIFAVEHGLYGADEAGVAIGLAQGVIAGVEAVGRLLHLPDGDGVGKVAIHIIPDLLRGPAHIQMDAGHHGPGVDSGIGAPGADEVHRTALETLQDGF